MSFNIAANLDRLTRLLGTDEGFYILALHSFVESFLRYQKGYGSLLKFPELTWTFRTDLLKQRGDEFIDGLNALSGLGRQHNVTNKVRHAFEALDPQEAAAATHLFLKFCLLAGIQKCPSLTKLESCLDLWNDRRSIPEQNSIIRQMQSELRNLRKEKKSFLAQQDEYRSLQAKIRELQVRLGSYTREIDKRSEIARKRDEKLDALREERNKLNRERNRLMAEAEQYSRFEAYLRYLGRLSLCTRTRMDYEHTIAELTPEQEAAVSSIKLKKDFLIRGGAGTGKSLVLIECLRRAALQKELNFGKNEIVVLVTFTRTLAKYNRYMSQLIGLHLPLDVISTVDKLFFDKLTSVHPNARYDFTLLDNFLSEFPPLAFFDSSELQSEIENFIFANDISREEYIDKMVSRKGMRKRLGKGMRKEVWKVCETLVSQMEEQETFTKNYGRLKLLRYLRQHPEDRGIRNIAHLFLDEVQDLTPVALQIMKELTRGAVVMAGDSGQSLYNFQSPFERAGMNMRGNTRILKTNFRNTRQIHQFAEAFRETGPERTEAAESEPFAFREGPLPEVYTADTAEALLELLGKEVSLYIDDLGYDPENICILVPRNKEITPVTEAAARIGCECCAVTAEDFDFSDSGRLRVSTLHSSKGLDFPVIMLYLPYLYRRKHFDEAEEELMLRNLVYVGITRAMDNVLIFTLPAGDPILNDLKILEEKSFI